MANIKLWTRKFGAEPEFVLIDDSEAKSYLDVGYVETQEAAWLLKPDAPDVEVLQLKVKDAAREHGIAHEKSRQLAHAVSMAEKALFAAQRSIPKEQEIQADVAFQREVATIRERVQKILDNSKNKPLSLRNDILPLATTDAQRKYCGRFQKDKYRIEQTEDGDTIFVADKPAYLAKQEAERVAAEREHWKEVRERMNQQEATV